MVRWEAHIKFLEQCLCVAIAPNPRNDLQKSDRGVKTDDATHVPRGCEKVCSKKAFWGKHGSLPNWSRKVLRKQVKEMGLGFLLREGSRVGRGLWFESLTEAKKGSTNFFHHLAQMWGAGGGETVSSETSKNAVRVFNTVCSRTSGQ